MQKPTPERLRTLLDYDPGSGLILWKVARPGVRRGDEAGSRTSHNGLLVSIDGQRLSLASVIWAMCYGEYPTRRVRLKDGNPDNLAIDNLTLYKELSEDRSHESFKAAQLRKVNAAAMNALKLDVNAYRDWLAADTRDQNRILGRYRDELRQRYPTEYPTDHLKRRGRAPKGFI